MKELLSLIILFLSIENSFSQTKIMDAEGNNIAYIKEQILLDSAHQVLYNYKGFILFNELSSSKNDIALTIDIRKNKTSIYKKVETTPNWIIRKNDIIWKNERENIDIIKIQKKDGFTSFYNINNDSLIAYIDTENVSALELSISLFYVWNTLNLEDLFLKEYLKTEAQNENLPEGILGAMKPVFGDEMNVWFWNGKYLFPAYNKDERYVWEFDGEVLKPIFNSRIENEWSWDGDELKPYWGGHPRNNWRWDNGILRQVFENNYKNEYEIVDNIVRKRFGSFGENEWQIEGEMPLPVLSLVLLGIVYR